MKITIQVSFRTPAAELVTEQVTTTIATAAAWERKFKRRASDLQAGVGIDDLMYMAWHRLNALKRDPRDYDVWLQSVEDFSVVETENANPTDPTASEGN